LQRLGIETIDLFQLHSRVSWPSCGSRWTAGGIIPEYMNDADATNIWWHLRNTYLYYHDHLGRHSWDDDDGEIEVYVHPNFASHGRSVPGCGLEFTNGYISLDVTAHEFTHEVID
jgi:Zn-dependent metalloprotease